MVATLLSLKEKERLNLSTGRIIGQYRIDEELLGKGAYSFVKLGYNVVTGEKVAVKIIDKSNASYQRCLTREVHALKSLNASSNIVKFIHFGIDCDFAYIVMELLTHNDMYNYLRENGPLSENIARKVFVQLIDALDLIHRKKFSHHDLKLDNILIDKNYQVKIIDFGLSIFLASQDKCSQFSGTPFYMPPEILERQPFQPQVADIWSLGVCLYQMVVNKRPFSGKNLHDLKLRVCTAEMTVPENRVGAISSDLLDLLGKMLTKNAVDRISVADIRNHSWLRV